MASGDTSYVNTSTIENQNASFTANNAVVFQCSKCSTIVGDSMSWVSATKSLRSISLSRATKNVSVANTLQVSQSGADKGSTYNSLSCEKCKTVIGKQYVASSAGLDSIRGAFTFTVNNLNSYELGTGELNAARSDVSLGDTIYKMQYVIHVLAERIKKVENRFSSGTSESDRHFNDGELELVSEADGVSSSDNHRNLNISNVDRMVNDQANCRSNDFRSERNSDFAENISELSYAPSSIVENSNMLERISNAQSLNNSKYLPENMPYLQKETEDSVSVNQLSSDVSNYPDSPKFRTTRSAATRGQRRMPLAAVQGQLQNKGINTEFSEERNQSMDDQLQSPPAESGPRVKRKRMG